MANKLQSSITRKNGEGEASWIRRIINACATDIRYITSLFKTSYSGEFIDGDGNTVTVVEGVITTVEAPTTLTLTWNDINNAMYTDVADYNSMFLSDFTTITTDGNDQILSGCTSEFTIAYMTDNTNIVSVIDNTGFGNSVGTDAFNGCFALTNVSLPSASSIGDSAFAVCTSLTNVSLPSASSVANYAFYGCTALTTVDLPSCTNLGGTTGGDSVFVNISGQTITLTVPAVLGTCNEGEPDGDIVYLAANNTATIIYV